MDVAGFQYRLFRALRDNTTAYALDYAVDVNEAARRRLARARRLLPARVVRRAEKMWSCDAIPVVAHTYKAKCLDRYRTGKFICCRNHEHQRELTLSHRDPLRSFLRSAAQALRVLFINSSRFQWTLRD
jgi:hypothetical protein